MRHVEKALVELLKQKPELQNFITIENAEDVKGVAPIVKFTIQSDPIKEVGINGVQAQDMLNYVKELFIFLDNAFPCEENKNTIKYLDLANDWQNRRTKDRLLRNVEGENKN